MASQLNIKDPTTIELARGLAQRSGKTVTATIRDALERERGEREKHTETLRAELRAITSGIRNELPPEWRDKSSVEICNSIYNDDGSFAE